MFMKYYELKKSFRDGLNAVRFASDNGSEGEITMMKKNITCNGAAGCFMAGDRAGIQKNGTACGTSCGIRQVILN